MTKVLSEFTGVLCQTCVMFNANGCEALHDLSEVDALGFINNISEFVEKYTFDVCDQWSEGYDEFSNQRCDCCGDSSGGDRYEATFTEFKKPLDMSKPFLFDMNGIIVRNATDKEQADSNEAAKHDNGQGLITINGVTYWAS